MMVMMLLKGPFRDPKEVQYLRRRAPCPSVRCQSSYFAVQEARKQHELDDWVQRITDDEYETHVSPFVLISVVLALRSDLVKDLMPEDKDLRLEDKDLWWECSQDLSS